jgi:hypothetical protein
MIRRLLGWIGGHLAAEVPKYLAYCEYECHKTTCSTGDWRTCERRICNAQLRLKADRNLSTTLRHWRSQFTE